MVSGLLATVILLAWMASLFVVRSLHITSRNVFLSEGKLLRLRGRPFESLHGFEAINDVTNGGHSSLIYLTRRDVCSLCSTHCNH